MMVCSTRYAVSHSPVRSKAVLVEGSAEEVGYYGPMVDGDFVEDAAWFYPDPKDAASNIKDHVAFYPGKVEVRD